MTCSNQTTEAPAQMLCQRQANNSSVKEVTAVDRYVTSILAYSTEGSIIGRHFLVVSEIK